MKRFHKVFILLAVSLITFMSCEDDAEETGEETVVTSEEENLPAIDFCECIDPLPENAEHCFKLYPEPLTEEDSIARNTQVKLCNGEEISAMDTLTKAQQDSVVKEYENDLSLEIKEIPEEIENPISEECAIFLKEYADEIKSFSSFIDKMEKNPDDINLLIGRQDKEEALYGYASNPAMFKCSENEAFKKQVEILNGKRDKLISN